MQDLVDFPSAFKISLKNFEALNKNSIYFIPNQTEKKILKLILSQQSVCWAALLSAQQKFRTKTEHGFVKTEKLHQWLLHFVVSYVSGLIVQYHYKVAFFDLSCTQRSDKHKKRILKQFQNDDDNRHASLKWLRTCKYICKWTYFLRAPICTI